MFKKNHGEPKFKNTNNISLKRIKLLENKDSMIQKQSIEVYITKKNMNCFAINTNYIKWLPLC